MLVFSFATQQNSRHAESTSTSSLASSFSNSLVTKACPISNCIPFPFISDCWFLFSYPSTLTPKLEIRNLLLHSPSRRHSTRFSLYPSYSSPEIRDLLSPSKLAFNVKECLSPSPSPIWNTATCDRCTTKEKVTRLRDVEFFLSSTLFRSYGLNESVLISKTSEIVLWFRTFPYRIRRKGFSCLAD